MVVLRGANEVLITIMRSMLYVSPHNNIIRDQLAQLSNVPDNFYACRIIHYLVDSCRSGSRKFFSLYHLLRHVGNESKDCTV